MPAIPWLIGAFVVGGVSGAYVMSDAQKMLGLGVLAGGAWYLAKKVK